MSEFQFQRKKFMEPAFASWCGMPSSVFFFDARKQGAGAVGLPSGFVSQVVPPRLFDNAKPRPTMWLEPSYLEQKSHTLIKRKKINVMNKLDKRIDKQSEN